ncbi:MAG: hypothetical protein JWO11_3470 [Nocardioides sp.]|nr:hypothetical protein [Nocardioides sp.]
MARTNPLGKLKDTALETLKHPVETAEKAVEQARGTVGVGKMVASHVTKSAGTRVARVVGAVASLRPGAKRSSAPHAGPAEAAAPAPTQSPQPVKAQADVVEPLVRKQAATARRAPAKKAAPVTSIDKGAKDVEVDVTPADIAKVVAKKAPAKKAAARKSAARRAPAAKTAGSTPGAKLPPRPRASYKSTAPVSRGQSTPPSTEPDTGGHATP